MNRSWKGLSIAIRLVRSVFANATVRYAGGIFVLLGFGIAGRLLSVAYLSPESIFRVVVVGLSDALLVAGMLAIVVDPYLKRRFQEGSGWDAVFGWLNPKAPKELRAA